MAVIVFPDDTQIPERECVLVEQRVRKFELAGFIAIGEGWDDEQAATSERGFERYAAACRPFRRVLEHGLVRDIITVSVDELGVFRVEPAERPTERPVVIGAEATLELESGHFRRTGIRRDARESILDAVTVGVGTDRSRNLNVFIVCEEHGDARHQAAIQCIGPPAEFVRGNCFRKEADELENLFIGDVAIPIEIRSGRRLGARIEAAALEAFRVREVNGVFVTRRPADGCARCELGPFIAAVEVRSRREHHRAAAKGR